jgi:hypothetical protein
LHDGAIRRREKFLGAVGDDALAFLRRAVLLMRGKIPPAVLDALVDARSLGGS